MEERKFVKLKKEELAMKKHVWRSIGKGKVSNIKVEYTPIGEKIIVSTDKPGLIIGSRGERINELTETLKKKFKLENPHIEIDEVPNASFNAKLVADKIALSLEKFGNLRFKSIAYRELTNIMKAGALGVELRLNGKLPSDRAKSWRFASGYLKKVGNSAKVVDKAHSTALTKLGITGINVSILSPDAKLHDKIEIDEAIKASINPEIIEEVKEIKPKKKRKKSVKKEDKEDDKKEKVEDKKVKKTKDKEDKEKK
jgi:small subunit ribosomal protein S3